MAVILNLHNQNADFYYKLALEQLEAGIHYEAILNLIKANELADDSVYRLQLAEAYYNTQNYAQSTNLYIKLLFQKRRLSYVLAIYRNMLLMGRTSEARRFILHSFQDFDGMLTDEYDELPEMDERELQKVLGLAENDDINEFINISDVYNEAAVFELKKLVEKSDFDGAIMQAQLVPAESKYYENAQEIICISAHARGDYELAEKTAREISVRSPDSVIAFGVLAVSNGRLSSEEVNERAAALYSLIKNRADKSLDFLKTLAHSEHTELYERYLEEISNDSPCVFGIIAFKMFEMYAKKRTEEGGRCLRRLQMLFPRDIKVRAYTALVQCKAPPHCFAEMKFSPFCTDIDAVEKRFFEGSLKTKWRKSEVESVQNLLCAMLLSAADDDVSILVSAAYGSYNSMYGSLDAFFEELLSDINVSGENKCDLVYGMLMYGWDSAVDVMMGDTFVHCRISSLGIGKLPIKLARLYTEIYVQLVSDGEEPRPEVLYDVIERMGLIGIKNGMKQEALLAVGHYIYELECGAAEEIFDEYIEIYEANPTTAERYLQVFKKITD